jgi:hypothetical protein
VDLEQIDALEAQSHEAGLDVLPQELGPKVALCVSVRPRPNTHLGGDDDVPEARTQGAHQDLVRVPVSVQRSRVEPVDADLHRRAHGRDRRVVVHRAPELSADRPTPEADDREAQIGPGERALEHHRLMARNSESP